MYLSQVCHRWHLRSAGKDRRAPCGVLSLRTASAQPKCRGPRHSRNANRLRVRAQQAPVPTSPVGLPAPSPQNPLGYYG
jgi:hypothetical protein